MPNAVPHDVESRTCFHAFVSNPIADPASIKCRISNQSYVQMNVESPDLPRGSATETKYARI